MASASSTRVMQLFAKRQVHDLLLNITGRNLEQMLPNALAKTRTADEKNARFYLMTDDMLRQLRTYLQEKHANRLQPPPYLLARPETSQLLARDVEISGHDEARFVFTDIDFGVNERERLVTVREPSGDLRIGTPAERDRMNRLYFPKPHRDVHVPPIFTDAEALQDAFAREDHRFILDYACLQLEPDDGVFTRVRDAAYDDVDLTSRYALLDSTRHFPGLAFHLVLHDRMDGIAAYLLQNLGREAAANLIRLYCIVYPDSDVAKSIDGCKDAATILEAYLSHCGDQSSKFVRAMQSLKEGTELPF